MLWNFEEHLSVILLCEHLALKLCIDYKNAYQKISYANLFCAVNSAQTVKQGRIKRFIVLYFQSRIYERFHHQFRSPLLLLKLKQVFCKNITKRTVRTIRSSHPEVIKNLLITIFQNSQENACAGVSLFKKFQAGYLQFTKKRTPTRAISCEFCKNVESTYFVEYLRKTASKNALSENP